MIVPTIVLITDQSACNSSKTFFYDSYRALDRPDYTSISGYHIDDLLLFVPDVFSATFLTVVGSVFDHASCPFQFSPPFIVPPRIKLLELLHGSRPTATTRSESPERRNPDPVSIGRLPTHRINRRFIKKRSRPLQRNRLWQNPLLPPPNHPKHPQKTHSLQIQNVNNNSPPQQRALAAAPPRSLCPLRNLGECCLGWER